MPDVLHDGPLWISIGQSRESKNWKNTELSWSELIQRLSVTHRTAETLAEYLKMEPALQDKRKDVGGFVGGVLYGSDPLNIRRKANAVTSRDVLTLDLDFTTMTFWDDFKTMFAQAACLYATHKHSPQAPRLRLIMPFTRDVLPDEYEAIARKVAELLDIEQFDDTTYQPSRLMYWPSTPCDVDYYFEFQDGDWLDPDRILTMYKDWKDVAQWPISSRRKTAISKAGEKQGEPTEKPGIIGAFCRIYSITDVLETFLSDTYSPVEDGERWSYIHGSTAGGLVLYDDKFAFSHHGTDPASGRLLNAFDLVRLHKFGKLDNDIKQDTPINRRPSHLEMEQWASKDKRVKIDLISRKTTEAIEDFGDIEQFLKDNKDWVGKLSADKKGKVFPTASNILIILQNDPHLKDCLGYNDFEHVDVAMSDLPWRKIKVIGEPLTDIDDAALRNYFDRVYEITGPAKIKDAFFENRARIKFHPVKDYLTSFVWDGNERLDTLLVDYFGAENTDYVRTITRKTLVAAVARVYEPGIKWEYVLTLAGEEGHGKSEFFNRLGGLFFSDSLGSIDNPKIAEQLQGVWILEIAELSAFNRTTRERVKHFVAQRIDRFRVSYGHRAENFARQCIFVASTNKMDFLTGEDGNRRYWPVAIQPDRICGSVFDDLNKAEIGQIWAEAVERYRTGETLFLGPDMARKAKLQQESFTERDDREDLILEFLERPENEGYAGEEPKYRNRVSTVDIWVGALGGLRKDMTNYNTKIIHNCMKKLKGWRRVDHPFKDEKYGSVRGYERIRPIIKGVD